MGLRHETAALEPVAPVTPILLPGGDQWIGGYSVQYIGSVTIRKIDAMLFLVLTGPGPYQDNVEGI